MMSWILDNYMEVFAAVGALATAAALLAKLTPNKTDDAIVAKVQKVLDFLSLRLLK